MTNPSPPEIQAADLIAQAEVVRPPVSVDQIAQMLGAHVAYEAFEGDVSGMLYRESGRTLIGVNSTHASTRQRFTLAHEIAHLKLHQGRPVFIDRLVRVNWRDGTSAPEEIQANAFAAELLMPRKFMTQEIERAMTKTRQLAPEQLIVTLADTFRVSEEAMRYRLINLGVLGPYSESSET
jgi:Zn-dependent peptidase ImmA (M78 family)